MARALLEQWLMVPPRVAGIASNLLLLSSLTLAVSGCGFDKSGFRAVWADDEDYILIEDRRETSAAEFATSYFFIEHLPTGERGSVSFFPVKDVDEYYLHLQAPEPFMLVNRDEDVPLIFYMNSGVQKVRDAGVGDYDNIREALASRDGEMLALVYRSGRVAVVASDDISEVIMPHIDLPGAMLPYWTPDDQLIVAHAAEGERVDSFVNLDGSLTPAEYPSCRYIRATSSAWTSSTGHHVRMSHDGEVKEIILEDLGCE